MTHYTVNCVEALGSQWMPRTVTAFQKDPILLQPGIPTSWDRPFEPQCYGCSDAAPGLRLEGFNVEAVLDTDASPPSDTGVDYSLGFLRVLL